MKSFKDNADTPRVWCLVITLGVVKRVKESLGIDLLQPEKGSPTDQDDTLLSRLGTDELLLAETIVAIMESEFEKHGVDQADVENTFDGRVMHDAFVAFYDEWIDFFHRLGRPERATAIEKQAALLKAGIEAAEKRVRKIDVSRIVDTMIPDDDPTDEILKKIDGLKSTASPGASESTPTP